MQLAQTDLFTIPLPTFALKVLGVILINAYNNPSNKIKNIGNRSAILEDTATRHQTNGHVLLIGS